MPHVMELRLIPMDSEPLPSALSYNSYALFLNILRYASPDFATELHEFDGAKPFTTTAISPFSHRQENRAAGMSHHLSLRLSFLTDEAFTRFLHSALEWESRELRLGTARFKVEQVHIIDTDKPHRNSHTYDELLSGAASERSIALYFSSPTAFRSAGRRNVLFPEPSLVFNSLLNRWNAFSPIKMDASLQQDIDSHILLSRYRLETRMINFGNYQETGFVGRCNFLLGDTLSEERVKSANALANFAFYSGVGAKTTMGMGQARRIRNGSSLSNRAGSNTKEGR